MADFRYKTQDGSAFPYEGEIISEGNANGTIYNAENMAFVHFGTDDYFDKDTLNYNFQQIEKLFNEDNTIIFNQIITKIYQTIYPIGSIYITATGINPGEFLTGTTWERIAQGKCLFGVNTGTGTDTAPQIEENATGGHAGAWQHEHNFTNNKASIKIQQAFTTDEQGEHSHRPDNDNIAYTKDNRQSVVDGKRVFIKSMPFDHINTNRVEVQRKSGSGCYTLTYNGPHTDDEFYPYIQATATTTLDGQHKHTINVDGSFSVTGNTNKSGAESNTDVNTANLPPYLGVYFWQRTE